MNRAIFFTAYDRPEYLSEVLDSWSNVRGFDSWSVVARVEPGNHSEEIVSMFEGFFSAVNPSSSEIIVNQSRLGVLHHPWVGFEELFTKNDFVVRTEDDLLVSPDVLEYFDWAASKYQDSDKVATVHGFSMGSGSNPSQTLLLPQFSPLVFGTWAKTWREIIGPTWDHDYSTFNGSPGNQSGWDWHLNTRIFPKYRMLGVYPEVSRVFNIGVHGTHSTPENYYTSETFLKNTGPVDYVDI